MPARRLTPRRFLSLVLTLGVLQGCQVFPGLTGPQEEGTVVFSTGKLLLGSRFVGLSSADGQAVGEISVQVGGIIYKSRNGKLLLPEYAVKQAQKDGLVVLVPGYLPRKVRMDETESIVLTPVHAPKVHLGVPGTGGTYASGDGTATVTLPGGFLKAPPTNIAVSSYTPMVEAHHQAPFDEARQAFLQAVGLSSGCDNPLPCGPLVHSLGLLLTIDGSVQSGQLPISFDLQAMLRGWDGQGAGPWEAAPGDWSEIQIAQAKAAAAIAQTLATLEKPEYQSARTELESRYGITWSGLTLTFTVSLGDTQIIDGLARVEIEGFDLLGTKVEVTVVSSVSESLPPAASQPALSGSSSTSGPQGAQGGQSGTSGGGIIAPGGGNIIAPGGGNIIAAGGGNIIATGGGNIIATGGGNIIAAGGGNIIATGGGNIIATGGGNFANSGGLTGAVRMPEAPVVAKYGLLAFTDHPSPNAEVRLVDLLGTPLTESTTADGVGTYRLTNLPQTPQAVFIEATSPTRLVRTFAPAPGDQMITADLDAATTAMTGYLIEELKSGGLASVDMAKFAEDVVAVRAAMSQKNAEDVTARTATTATAAALIRSLAAAGTISLGALTAPTVETVAVAGTLFNAPAAVAVDASGNLYVADSRNHVIRKLRPNGTAVTLAGNGMAGSADGTGKNARFNVPSGLAIDASGNLFVADTFNSRIRKISPSGDVTTYAGSAQGFADGAAGNAMFDAPTGLAIDGAGNLFVADKANHRIRKIRPDGVVSTVAGTGSGYLDDTYSRAQFSEPTGVAVDSAGNVFVADSGNGCVRKISKSGVVTTLIGGKVTVPSAVGTGFSKPWSLAIDQADYLYMADFAGQRLFVIGPDGAVAALAGSGSTGASDGPGTSATFNGPMGVTLGGSGIFYLTDRDGDKLRKVTVPAAWVTSQLVAPLPGTTSTNSVFTLSGQVTFTNGGYPATVRFAPRLDLDADGGPGGLTQTDATGNWSIPLEVGSDGDASFEIFYTPLGGSEISRGTVRLYTDGQTRPTDTITGTTGGAGGTFGGN